jgi:hypothetical protein
MDGGMFTGHCHLKGHLFKLGMTDDPICEGAWRKMNQPHVPCDCEAIAHLRFRHLGQFFTEPGDYHDIPISKVLQFVRSAGLIRG